MSRLGDLLGLYCRVNRVSTRTLGAEIGVSAATVSRITTGRPMDQVTMIKVINWLFKEDK